MKQKTYRRVFALLLVKKGTCTNMRGEMYHARSRCPFYLSVVLLLYEQLSYCMTRAAFSLSRGCVQPRLSHQVISAVCMCVYVCLCMTMYVRARSRCALLYILLLQQRSVRNRLSRMCTFCGTLYFPPHHNSMRGVLYYTH